MLSRCFCNVPHGLMEGTAVCTMHISWEYLSNGVQRCESSVQGYWYFGLFHSEYWGLDKMSRFGRSIAQQCRPASLWTIKNRQLMIYETSGFQLRRTSECNPRYSLRGLLRACQDAFIGTKI